MKNGFYKRILALTMSAVLTMTSASVVLASEAASADVTESDFVADTSSGETAESSVDTSSVEEAESEAGDIFEDGTEAAVASASVPGGSCGENITWRLENGTLYINGTGEITSNGWWSYANNPLYRMSKVEISEGVTSICGGAFSLNGFSMGIQKVNLPTTLTSIGDNAFKGNPLTDSSAIRISARITHLGKGAFSNTGITALDLSAYTGAAIPADIAASCNELLTVKLPAKVTEVGKYAFQKCSKLTSFTLPDGVETIGAGAFAGCTLLEHINIPGTVKTMNRRENDEGIFANCPRLKTAGPGSNYNIDLQWEAGAELPYSTFNSADKLETIVIPDGMIGVMKEENYPSWCLDAGTSFAFATSLKNVTLPSSFTEFGYGAFKGCSSLVSVNIPQGTKELTDTFDGCSSLTEMTVPDGVEKLSGTFGNCTSLKKVNIPDSVISLEAHHEERRCNTFENCTALTSLTVPASVTMCGYSHGPFRGSALDSVGPIGSGASLQYGWTTAIPDAAFEGMKIQEVILPDEVTSIGNYAFANCKKLKRIKLPDTVKEISGNLFSGCSSLTTIRLPESITTIGNSAFEDCTALKNLNFKGDAPTFQEYVFRNDNLTAYYPKENKTWTRSVRRNYDGKVKWRPYVPGKPVDDLKERSVTLNGGGSATARFFLCDETGDTDIEQNFSFTRRSSAKGLIEEFVGAEYITDFDGGYAFATPYYSNPASRQTDDVEYEVTWTDESGEVRKDTFTIHVTINPATYTETWSTGFGADFSGGSDKTEWFSGGHEVESAIQLEHNGDGTQDLTLELAISTRAAARLKSALKEPEQGSWIQVSAAKASGSAKATQYYNYGTTIYDFSTTNTNHQKMLAAYLNLMYLFKLDITGGAGKLDALAKQIFGSSFLSSAYDSFEVSESGIKVSLSGSDTVLQLENLDIGGLAAPIKLGALNTSSTYTAAENRQNGVETVSAGVKSSETFAILSGSMLSLIGDTGLGGYHNVNSASASVTENKVSYHESAFSSGQVDEVGYDELISTDNYTISNGSDLIGKSNGLQSLAEGRIIPLDSGKIYEIGSLIKESDLDYSYSVTDTMSNTYSWEPSINIYKNKSDAELAEGGNTTIKPFLNLGFGFSYTHGWKTETSNGTVNKRTVLTDVDSSSTIQMAKKDADSQDLGTILLAAAKGMTANVQEAVSSAAGSLGETIKQGFSSLKSNLVEGAKWSVSLISRSKAASMQAVDTYAVSTVSNELQAAALSEGNEEAAKTANTVGDAVLVYVTDETSGKAITDLSSSNMELSLQYTQEDLEAAGASLNDVKNLGIYRYDEESGAYIFLPSELDEANQQLTTVIDKAAEYILIYDGAEPAVTDINVRSKTSYPVITASITDLSGVTYITMAVDGTELVNEENFTDYYNARTGLFAYEMEEAFTAGSHTIRFRAADQKGQTADDVTYEFMVNGTPEFTEIKVPQYALSDAEKLSVSVKVHSPLDEELIVTAKAAYEGQKIACRMTETEEGWTGYIIPGMAMEEGGRITVTFTVSNGNGDVTTSEPYECCITAGDENDWGCRYEGDPSYTFNLGTNTLSSISTNRAELTIPDIIDGIPVYTVDLDSFKYQYDGLKKIIIPATVKKITAYDTDNSSIVIQGYTNSAADYFAQYHNLKFESVGEIPDEGTSGTDGDLNWTFRNDGTLTVSGEGAMDSEYTSEYYSWYGYRRNIRKVVILDGVTSIGSHAFDPDDYPNLTEAVIPKSVTEIEYSNFRSGKTRIFGYYGSEAHAYARSEGIAFSGVEPLTGKFGADDALSWTYDAGTLTISGKGAIPDYTADEEKPWSKIPYYDIETIIIKEGITAIGAYAFEGMRETEKWSLPNTLKTIGECAFLDASGVTGCVIPSGVTAVGAHAIGYMKNVWGDGSNDENAFIPLQSILRSDSAAVKAYGEENGITILGAAEYWDLTEDSCDIWIQDAIYEGTDPVSTYYSVYDLVHQRSLIENVDYKVTYENNTAVGNATAVFTGIGAYQGTVKKSFLISKKSWFIYTDEYEVTLNSSPKEQYYTIQVEGDYDQLKYTSSSTSVKVAKNGKVTIPANYTGTFEIEIEALENDICDASMILVEFTVKGAHTHSYGNWTVTKQPTALATGQKSRSCTCGKKETATIVKLKPTIKLTASSLLMKKRQKTTAFKAFGFVKGDYLKSVKSGNTKIVQVSRVNKKGTFKLTAKATGKTTITLTLASKLTKKVTIKVQKGSVKTTKIAGVAKKATLKKGKSLRLKPVLAPVTSQEKITYRTSNKKVATVSKSGKITAKKKGRATITVKSGKKAAKITITVK